MLVYPYAKENLVPYRSFLSGGFFAFVFWVVFGIITRQSAGLLFGLTGLMAAVVGPGRALFRWHSEPTAKRQYATLLIIMVVVAVLGGFVTDEVIARYHLAKGECPIWLDFADRCRPA
ncbi:hypothetical protein [Brevundimonas viscosa]|uniref:Uncharacterized protein n=1 Tax=Brevundimonas viscosa TaxID=871741 RepID=A0A1I6TQM0_9CAUL|nr:hypothetical protein [Brevundimonas viscosa]SFS91470.1 hypothetical protein SAMN05192570_0259 [Brevundimonas viscosa]